MKARVYVCVCRYYVCRNVYLCLSMCVCSIAQQPNGYFVKFHTYTLYDVRVQGLELMTSFSGINSFLREIAISV